MPISAHRASTTGATRASSANDPLSLVRAARWVGSYPSGTVVHYDLETRQGLGCLPSSKNTKNFFETDRNPIGFGFGISERRVICLPSNVRRERRQTWIHLSIGLLNTLLLLVVQFDAMVMHAIFIINDEPRRRYVFTQYPYINTDRYEGTLLLGSSVSGYLKRNYQILIYLKRLLTHKRYGSRLMPLKLIQRSC